MAYGRMNGQSIFRRQAWNLLAQELDSWQKQGLTATFWWRDDDVCRQTSELDRLNTLSAAYEIPVALAAIPNQIHPDLRSFVDQHQNITILQHGFDHKSHAKSGQKKRELGGWLSDEEIADQLLQGRQTLQQNFGENFVPVMVPPWNRIDDRVTVVLAELGFSGLSSMWARHPYQHQSGIIQVNTHVDPVAWRQNQVFIGESLAIGQIVQHLSSKRHGFRDARAPTGLLTHHLVQKDSVWGFCGQLFQFLAAWENVRWLCAREIWRI